MGRVGKLFFFATIPEKLDERLRTISQEDNSARCAG
jgi:hypothetical protein